MSDFYSKRCSVENCFQIGYGHTNALRMGMPIYYRCKFVTILHMVRVGEADLNSQHSLSGLTWMPLCDQLLS